MVDHEMIDQTLNRGVGACCLLKLRQEEHGRFTLANILWSIVVLQQSHLFEILTALIQVL